MSRTNLIVLASSGAAWLALYHLIAVQDRALVIDASPQFGTIPCVRVRLAGRPEETLPAKVLFIHGLSASKSAMKQMASEVARWGCDCYLIDLPGHGNSRDRFSLQAAVGAADQVVQELLSTSNRAAGFRQPVVVIGHSFGARVALSTAQRRPEIAAVIALSPAAEPLTPRAMPPLLIVVGEFDFPFVRRGSQFLYGQAAGDAVPKPDQPGQWQNSSESARLVVLPRTDHSLTLFKPAALAEVRRWLEKVNPAIAEAPFFPKAFRTHTLIMGLFCVLPFLIWFPAVALLGKLLAPEASTRASHPVLTNRGPKGLFFKLVGVYGIAALLATLALRGANPWENLKLLGGDYLTGLLCLTGILGLAALRPRWASRVNCWRPLLWSFLAWLALVAGASPWITTEFVHLELSAARLWRLPWLSLSLLPFFLLDEQACRRMVQGLGTLRTLLFHLSTRFVVAIVLLLGFFIFSSGQFLVVLILPGLLLANLLCWCSTSWIYRKTGSVAASGIFGALAAAWFFSVFFAQL